jgi:predicted acetyltransferase
MTVSLRDAREHEEDCEWMESVYRDYLDDLRARRTGLFPVLGAVGLAESHQVQGWLADRDATLLTILHQGRHAGFALLVAQHGRQGVDYRLTEFFIARPLRRRGLGREAARLIFDRFAGRWEVVQDAGNPAAIAFWRNVVAAYTRGDYRERTGHGEVRHYFSSANRKMG